MTMMFHVDDDALTSIGNEMLRAPNKNMEVKTYLEADLKAKRSAEMNKEYITAMMKEPSGM